MPASFTVTVTADLSDRFKSRIRVDFPYDRDLVQKIKNVPGSQFVGKGKLRGEPGPYWTVPKDMTSAKALRREFGKDLALTERLAEWGWEQKQYEDAAGKLASATDADLELVPDRLPGVAEALRPYQRAGSKFLSLNGGLIADEPGLGKTLQAIAGLAEAGMLSDPDGRSFLVVAPLTSLEVTWLKELSKWQDQEVFVATGSRAEREEVMEEFVEHREFTGTGWLVVNPAMVRFRNEWLTDRCVEHGKNSAASDKRSCGYCEQQVIREYDFFNDIKWDAVIIDESHDVIRNPKTLTARGVFDLPMTDDGVKIAMTGTPIMNIPLDLWAVLHWLNPDSFSSKWRWAEQFCEIHDNGYGKVIGGLRPEATEELFESIKPYVLRRKKTEVAKDLPAKNRMDVHLTFTNREHEKQYRQFQAEAFMKINDLELGATGVLDEITRLRQFAIALCDVNENPKGDGHPLVVQQTTTSAKVDWLDEHLMELGILDRSGQAADEGKVVIFSQFTRVLKMLKNHYEEKGVKTGAITGGVSQKNRRLAVDDFQNPDSDTRVMLVSTRAGGTSIELDAADDVVFMDETWNHGLMEQAEDRVHRANKGRTRPVNIYILRMEDTVETETIMPKVMGKREMAEFIMDIRREISEEN